MTSKEIISELKKYNKELEKHVPGLDLDIMKEIQLFKNGTKDEDYFTLFAENLVDLRTEIALMRKNLTTDVEGMVLRVVNDQQNQFAHRMNDFFVKAILDVKENWNKHLNHFTDEMQEVKKTFNEMKVENENLSNTLRNVNEELMILKSTVSSIDNRYENLDVSSEISMLKHEVLKIANSVENKALLEKNFENLASQYKSVLLKISDLKRTTDKNVSTTISLKESEEKLKESLKKRDLEFKKQLELTSNNLLKTEDKILKKAINGSESFLKEQLNKKTQEILDLEKKLKKSVLGSNTKLKSDLEKKLGEIKKLEEDLDKRFNTSKVNIENKIDKSSKKLNKNLSTKINKVKKLEKELNQKIDDLSDVKSEVISSDFEVLEKEEVPLKSFREIEVEKKILDIDSRLSKLSSLR